MRIVKKNVYYCDFCKKHSLVSLAFHEKHCTGNSARACRMCGRVAGGLLPIIEEMRQRFRWQSPDEYGFCRHLIDSPDEDEFGEQIDYCPACALTILKAISPPHAPWPEWFSYQEWHTAWWQERNQEAMKAGIRYGEYF